MIDPLPDLSVGSQRILRIVFFILSIQRQTPPPPIHDPGVLSRKEIQRPLIH